METILMTVYVLMWPAIVIGILGILVKGFVSDWKQARREGRPLI